MGEYREIPAETPLHKGERELEIEPRWLCVETATFYPRWYPGPKADHDLVDKIRGDLAIETITEAKKKGFQIALVDGGSSDAFKAELVKLGVTPSPELERGMSPGRQQSFKEGSALEGVRINNWLEPEKVSIVRDCLPAAILPIIEGTADVVVPERDEAAWETYPDYQVDYEKRANHLWNAILRKHNLLPQDAPDLDAWFGPKFWKNDPELNALFLKQYEFEKRKLKLDQIVRPELWPNAIFLPIVAALHQGRRVASMPVSYRHPQEQTGIELNNPEFRRRRDVQLKNIIASTIHFIRLLEGNPKTRLMPK